MRGGLNSGGVRAGGLVRPTEITEDAIIDDFEDADLAEYDLEANGGASAYDLVTAPIHEGSYALQVAGDTSYPKIGSTGGLDHYPVEGSTIEVWIYIDGAIGTDTTDFGYYFGLQDFDNSYFTDFEGGNDNVRVYERDAGTSSLVVSDTSAGLVSGEWLRTEVTWTSTDMTLRVERTDGTLITEITGSHSQLYTSGGWGFYGAADSGAAVLWDYANIPEGASGGGGGGGADPTTIDDFEDESFDPYTEFVSDGEYPFRFTNAASTSEPIGGGDGYPNTVAEADAQYTASTSSELRNALSSASAGDIVYVTADIDTRGESSYTVPSGVTLAGDRGINGSSGPLILHGERYRGCYLNQDARLTGLRIRGPHYTGWSPDSSNISSDEDWYQNGVTTNGTNAEIDNCEIWGHGESQILGDADDAHIHHCNIHHGCRDGVGYGINNSSEAGTIIEYCRLSFCRHMTADSGSTSANYTTRQCLTEEPHGGSIHEMHDPGGYSWYVENCEIVSYDSTLSDTAPWINTDETTQGVAQRGTPELEHHTSDTWFWNYLPPDTSTASWDDRAIVYVDTSWPDNVDWSNCQFGADSRPPSDIGMTADGRTLRDAGERALVYLGSRKRHGYLSTSGLDVYPEAGDTFRFWFRWEGRHQQLAQVFFGLQSESAQQDCYEIEIYGNDRGNELRLEVDEAGSDTTLGLTDLSMEPQVSYRFEVDWSDPGGAGIQIDVYNHRSNTLVASLSADPDTTWSSGGIGFYGNSYSGFMLDDIELF